MVKSSRRGNTGTGSPSRSVTPGSVAPTATDPMPCSQSRLFTAISRGVGLDSQSKEEMLGDDERQAQMVQQEIGRGADRGHGEGAVPVRTHARVIEVRRPSIVLIPCAQVDGHPAAAAEEHLDATARFPRSSEVVQERVVAVAVAPAV